MEKMLTELCQELRNYFTKEVINGVFKIEGGTVYGLDLLDGQYFRIVGSILNDGVHKYPTTDLEDETFVGAIWSMAVPPAVIDLGPDIENWKTANADVLNSPYTSESFGGYSYTKSSSYNSDGSVFGWKNQFASQLNRWRKIHV